MTQKNIILTTLNSRYSHTSIALRYLFANLKEFKDETNILEFVINEDIGRIAEDILKFNPKIIGIGVYIWNALDVAKLVKIIKKISPETMIILGGPEISYFPHRVDFDEADFIICGEGETKFHQLCKAILQNQKPQTKIIQGDKEDFANLDLPYEFYTEEDIKNRHIYFEASRGCPFHCEFCLSSIDNKMRYLPIQKVLSELEKLWQRGARNFKFIDRTFNININFGVQLLEYFLSKEDDFFVHFEVIPDNFPDELKILLQKFKKNSLQLEVGLQTLDLQIAKNIKRNLKLEKIFENIKFLNQTQAHLHLDLIVGLPGESLRSFANNLDLLTNLTNSEIQIGILKKLSGTTLDRHDQIFGMVYSDFPPYDILKNNLIDFFEMQKMKRFARFWDIVYNSGNFKNTFMLLKDGDKIFDRFYDFCNFVYRNTKSTNNISPSRMATFLQNYLNKFHTPDDIERALSKDKMMFSKSSQNTHIARQLKRD